LATDSKRCGDQKWLCPLQRLRAAFSTDSASGEEVHGVRRVEPESSPALQGRLRAYVTFPSLTFQTLALCEPFLPGFVAAHVYGYFNCSTYLR